MFVTVINRQFYPLDMCYKTIAPHNRGVLYGNIVLQADTYFDLQAQVRIFLTLHILKYSTQVNIYVLNYSPHRHQSTYLKPDLIFLFLILFVSSSLYFISACNVFCSNITCNMLLTPSHSYGRFQTIEQHFLHPTGIRLCLVLIHTDTLSILLLFAYSLFFL